MSTGSARPEAIVSPGRVLDTCGNSLDRPAVSRDPEVMSSLSPHLGTNGAAAAVSLATVSAVVGRMLLGWLIGVSRRSSSQPCRLLLRSRFSRRSEFYPTLEGDRRFAVVANFLVQCLGVVLLCVGSGTPVLLAGCILFGLGVGNVAALPALIALTEFRPPDVATVVALVIAINQAVFALAPAALGSLRQVSADYTLSFSIAAAIQVLAAFVILVGAARSPGPARS